MSLRLGEHRGGDDRDISLAQLDTASCSLYPGHAVEPTRLPRRATAPRWTAGLTAVDRGTAAMVFDLQAQLVIATALGPSPPQQQTFDLSGLLGGAAVEPVWWFSPRLATFYYLAPSVTPPRAAICPIGASACALVVVATDSDAATAAVSTGRAYPPPLVYDASGLVALAAGAACEVYTSLAFNATAIESVTAHLDRPVTVPSAVADPFDPEVLYVPSADALEVRRHALHAGESTACVLRREQLEFARWHIDGRRDEWWIVLLIGLAAALLAAVVFLCLCRSASRRRGTEPLKPEPPPPPPPLEPPPPPPPLLYPPHEVYPPQELAPHELPPLPLQLPPPEAANSTAQSPMARSADAFIDYGDRKRRLAKGAVRPL